MSHGNGNGKPPLAFTAKPEIPIIGQPFTMKSWFMTIQVMCNCGQHEPVLIVGQPGTAGICPACRKAYVWQGFKPLPDGQIQFMIAVGMAQPVEAPPSEPVSVQ